MSARALGFSFMLAAAGAGAWAAASIALGSPFAFVALGVGLLGGLGIMLSLRGDEGRVRLGLGAACMTALAIFVSRFAVMYAQAGASPEATQVGNVVRISTVSIGMTERLERIGRAGGVHGEMGVYGVLWLALGSLVCFKVATLGERVDESFIDRSIDHPLGEDGLLRASTGVVGMTTPWDAPKDDGLPSLAPADPQEQLMPFNAIAKRQAA